MNAVKTIDRCLFAVGVALTTVAINCDGFTAPVSRHSIQDRAAIMQRPATAPQDSEDGVVEQNRRSVLSSMLATTVGGVAGASVIVMLPSAVFAEAETMERGGVKLTPFNSLAFNYREGESPTVDASVIKEATMPYSEFLEKLDAGQVEFVDFLAPNGDAAYATLKSTAGEGEDGVKNENKKPIRIGEGYPLEDPSGWSSPAFVIKAVAKKGVPYKFIVPGLSDSFKT